ncbi:MAG: hypothetical protein IJY28_00625 [Clostridia bacterium]|nr:hypothetical protein [Clostridia bacterium]
MFVSLKALIKDAIDKKGSSVTKIAPALHMPARTLYFRLKDPDTFTVGELKIIARVLKIKPEDILRAIMGKELNV